MLKTLLIICFGAWSYCFNVYGSYLLQNDTINDFEQLDSKLNYYRNLLFQNIFENKISEINNITSKKIYLKLDDYKYNETRLFYKNELHLIYFITKNHKRIIEDIKHPGSSNAIINDQNNDQLFLPEPENYYSKLVLLYYEDEKPIKDAIENAPLNNEEKSFLRLYLKYLLALEETENLDKDKIRELAQTHFDNYPNSPFERFIRNNIFLNFRISKFGIGASAFLGFTKINKSLGDNFSSYMPIGCVIDLSYSNIIFNLGITGSFAGKVKGNFTVNSGSETDDWNDGMRSSIVNFEGWLGYAIINNKKVRLYPYIGSGTTVFSSFENSEDTLRKPEIRNFPSVTTGLVFDWKFTYNKNTPLSYRDAFASENNNSYGYLRFRVSYTDPFLENIDSRFKGNMLFFTVGVGLFVNPAIQVKHE